MRCFDTELFKVIIVNIFQNDGTNPTRKQPHPTKVLRFWVDFKITLLVVHNLSELLDNYTGKILITNLRRCYTEASQQLAAQWLLPSRDNSVLWRNYTPVHLVDYEEIITFT